VPPPMAEAMRRMHPLRLQYEMLGPSNPLAAWISAAADLIRENRRPVSEGNPFVALQEQMSRRIVDGLEGFRQTAERMAEETFHSVYGQRALQSALGADTTSDQPPRKAAKSLLHGAVLERRIAELRAGMGQGDTREALARALFYAGSPRGGVDERGFEAIRRLRSSRPDEARLKLPEFKAMLREQFLMLLIDEDAALAAIPALLPKDAGERRAAFGLLREILSAAGEPVGEVAVRLRHLAELFGIEESAIRPPTRAGSHAAE
jgi:Protein of unknown function (DUF3141)